MASARSKLQSCLAAVNIYKQFAVLCLMRAYNRLGRIAGTVTDFHSLSITITFAFKVLQLVREDRLA